MGVPFIEDLLETMAIPSDGTLSKVLFHDDNIRVVGFAFDAGQELTEHRTPLAAVIQVISGRIDVGFSGEHHLLGPTSWLLIPPARPHTLLATEPSVVLLTMIRTAQATSE